mgnify:CR=1 FL=1
MSIELTRTDLTDYETAQLHAVDQKVYEHSIAVGAFMTRYGRHEVLVEAADVFMQLHDSLLADADIRTGALEYGMVMAEFSSNDRVASQAHQLRERFIFDLYRAVIAERQTEKVGA